MWPLDSIIPPSFHLIQADFLPKRKILLSERFCLALTWLNVKWQGVDAPRDWGFCLSPSLHINFCWFSSSQPLFLTAELLYYAISEDFKSIFCSRSAILKSRDWSKQHWQYRWKYYWHLRNVCQWRNSFNNNSSYNNYNTSSNIKSSNISNNIFWLNHQVLHKGWAQWPWESIPTLMVMWNKKPRIPDCIFLL